MSYSEEQLSNLIDELRFLPKETEWVEFKVGNTNNVTLGENISALSNSATLHGKEKAYVVFGIHDDTHEVVGTSFNPQAEKIGNEELENWLATSLDPRINFTLHLCEYVPGTNVVIFEIDAAIGFPVSFKKKVYIRVGSYTKPIADHRGKEKALWSKLDKRTFESGIAKSDLDEEEVLGLLEYTELFKRLDLPIPTSKGAIVRKLVEEELVVDEKGMLSITNLGAILFAADITQFETVARKALRVIVYKGKDKLVTSHEQKGLKGYAVGVDRIVRYIQNYAGSTEVTVDATRKDVPTYPNRAVREILANALIHQDFSIGGAGPMVEIFEGRMEISNPGIPLIEISRIIDHSPRSRNERLAGLMARMHICEERGSGIDRVVIECELNQLPAPAFSAEDDFMRATLFSARTLRDMTREDKIRATYYHAVIRYITDGYMENNTLRERFGIAKDNYPTASNIIRMTIDAGFIKNRDADSATKYVPYWA